jgi:hypothetical protein
MWPCIKISRVYVMGNVKSSNVKNAFFCSLWCWSAFQHSNTSFQPEFHFREHIEIAGE